MTLRGSICALITPFAADGSIDEPALLRLLDLHLAAGSHGLVVAGSTGEANLVDDAEYARVLALAVQRCAGRLPVLAGCGAPATARTLALCRIARDAGVDAALVVTPAYVRPTQEGLYRHYHAVADSGLLPVVLYNVPSRTGCDLLPETVARLCGHPAIHGIKEAVAEPARLRALLALQGPGFDVLSGDDGTACAALLAGARGVVSVAANIVPGPFAQMCDHAAAGRRPQALAIDDRLQSLYDMLGREPNPIPAKWMLHHLGLCGPDPRLPLTPLSPALQAAARAVLEGLGAMAAGAADQG